MHDLQMHLTNCAIQRRVADGGADAPAAIKWPVRRRAHAFPPLLTYLKGLATACTVDSGRYRMILTSIA